MRIYQTSIVLLLIVILVLCLLTLRKVSDDATRPPNYIDIIDSCPTATISAKLK